MESSLRIRSLVENEDSGGFFALNLGTGSVLEETTEEPGMTGVVFNTTVSRYILNTDAFCALSERRFE